MTAVPPSSPPSSSTMRRDVISAYLATAAKIGAWVVVLGLLKRSGHSMEFAILALIRGTIGILNYTTLGLSPAMIRMLAETRNQPTAAAVAIAEGGPLSYYAPSTSQTHVRSLYANGLVIAMGCAVLGLGVTLAYAGVFNRLYHDIPTDLAWNMPRVVFWMGLGTVLRLASDAPGALLQAHGLIARDNYRVAFAELAWVVFVFAAHGFVYVGHINLYGVAFSYGMSGALLLVARVNLAREVTGMRYPAWRMINETSIRQLLGFGTLVLFAQLADYLYAPTDFILIKLLMNWRAVEVYTPAVQIDAGLLLLVSGLSSVMLPRAALAHTAGEVDRVRRYYIWGTTLSAALLALAGGMMWLLSPWIFRLWLGDPMTATQAILPLVLIHTVIGGSSAVGRSILLGMGQARPFTAAVLIAGVSNVVLSYIFVRHLHLGLPGIVLGTIVVVVARCAIWMPWYVLKSLRSGNEIPAADGR